MLDADVARVLTAYPQQCQPDRVEALGSAGGFSGARFWRLSTAAGLMCLRRSPGEGQTAGELRFVQSLLRHVARQGFLWVPTAHPTRDGGGWVDYGGFRWELTPWMPGKADFHQMPALEKLRAAMSALAGFHLAAASFSESASTLGRSPGIGLRLLQLDRWRSGQAARLARAIRPGVWPELARRAGRILKAFYAGADHLLHLLQGVANVEVPLQACIRDVWHDHVLFEGEKVSGLIDFGAVAIDNPSIDVARLLGSLVGDDRAGWQDGLTAYQALRLMSAAELAMVRAFDASGVLMAGLNWLEWIYVEGRQFENPVAVLARVDAILHRLERLVDTPSGG